jgi:hypothetical protein
MMIETGEGQQHAHSDRPQNRADCEHKHDDARRKNQLAGAASR